MTRKLLLLTFILVFAASYGCAKKAAGPAPGVGPGAATVGAPGTAGAAPGTPGAMSEESLGAPGATAAPVGEAAAGPQAKDNFVNNDVHFDFDKYDITPAAADILDAKASYLKTNGNVRIRIEGNCDERGSSEYNLALGERRAQAAKDYLTNAGIDATRIDCVSYGEERPLDPAHSEEAWAKNRRDHFTIL